MDDIKETIICAAVWALFGFSAMGGVKAADWLIPSPPSTTIKVDVHQGDNANTTAKRPYLIG
ncbi:MAG TPA: hypothetical protein VGE12_00335 [Noviherbaspirillum sp.]